MQELIDEMKEYNMILVKEGIQPNPLIHMLQHKAEKLLEKEKEQIIDSAYEFMGTNFDSNRGRAELYYEETFNK